MYLMEQRKQWQRPPATGSALLKPGQGRPSAQTSPWPMCTPLTLCYFLVTKACKKVPAALLLFLQLVSKHLQVFFQKENFRKKASPTWIFLAWGFNHTPAGTGVCDHNPALYSRRFSLLPLAARRPRERGSGHGARLWLTFAGLDM